MKEWAERQFREHGVDPENPRKAARGARAPSHVDGLMNQTEGRCASHLRALQHAGIVERWAFEARRLKLPAERTSYLPDFEVVLADAPRTLYYIEVKGHYVYERAKVKFKIASGLNPADVFIWLRWSIPKANPAKTLTDRQRRKKRKGHWKIEVWQAGQRRAPLPHEETLLNVTT